jgi:hypothetical protein
MVGLPPIASATPTATLETERVRLFMDGLERTIYDYMNMPIRNCEESARAFGQVLASIDYYRERLGITS